MSNSSKEEQQTPPYDRRDDMSKNMAWFLITLCVLGFVSIAWATAKDGTTKAEYAITSIHDKENRITKLETQFDGIKYRLDELKEQNEEIKGLVKSIQH